MVSGGASYILEMIMLTLVFLSGASLVYFKTTEKTAGTTARAQYYAVMALKFVLWVFITPVTDLILFSWVSIEGQTRLTGA